MLQGYQSEQTEKAYSGQRQAHHYRKRQGASAAKGTYLYGQRDGYRLPFQARYAENYPNKRLVVVRSSLTGALSSTRHRQSSDSNLLERRPWGGGQFLYPLPERGYHA